MLNIKTGCNDHNVQTRNRITNQAYFISFALLLTDILYRTLFLRQPIAQDWDLVVIFMAGAVFVTVATASCGVFSDGSHKTLLTGMIASFGLGIVAIIFAIHFNSIDSPLHFGMGVFAGIAGTFLVLFLFTALYRHKKMPSNP
jgi:hypothetical protein